MWLDYEVRQQVNREWTFICALLKRAGVTDETRLELMKFLYTRGFEQGFESALPKRTLDGRFKGG